jgi:hypothetical protein
MLELLDLICGHLHLNDGSSGDRNIVPMKVPLTDEPLVVSVDVVLCPIGRSNILAGYTLMFLHVAGNRGDYVGSPLVFLDALMVLVISGLASFHLHDVIGN